MNASGTPGLLLTLASGISIATGIALAGGPFDGQTLVTTANSSTTRLIDLDGTVAHTWQGTNPPASMAYLLDDGSIVRPARHSIIYFQAGGVGGRIQRIDDQDVIVWNYVFASQAYQQHHDIEPMPNGNVLIVAWERRSHEEAVAAGRVGVQGEVWPTYIAEVQPTGPTTADIVWQWRFWDHLIQDTDPGKPNHGVVADHPERLDINAGSPGGDWVHVNAIDYDPVTDQILFSSRSLNEIYVIDHSTTTAEAAGSTGGNSGMGGDLLYRWGNPQIYDRGTSSNQYLQVVHGANWIDAGFPGEGNILLFNNGDRPGGSNDYSTVAELVPPRNPDGTYQISMGAPYGPASPIWTHGAPGEFYGGPVQCGAFRLPNGNTLVTLSNTADIFEVTPSGETVWTYHVNGGVNRAQRYSEAGPAGMGDVLAASRPRLVPSAPNPFRASTILGFLLPFDAAVNLSVFSVAGERVATLADGWRPAGNLRVIWDGRNSDGERMASGVYFARLNAAGEVAVRRLVLQK